MTTRQKVVLRACGNFIATVLATSCVRMSAQLVKAPVDPGVRGGAAGAGSPLQGLTAGGNAFFQDGLGRVAEIETVTGGSHNGRGSRFNSKPCFSLHSQPAPRGSGPAPDPFVAVATPHRA